MEEGVREGGGMDDERGGRREEGKGKEEMEECELMISRQIVDTCSHKTRERDGTQNNRDTCRHRHNRHGQVQTQTQTHKQRQRQTDRHKNRDGDGDRDRDRQTHTLKHTLKHTRQHRRHLATELHVGLVCL